MSQTSRRSQVAETWLQGLISDQPAGRGEAESMFASVMFDAETKTMGSAPLSQ